MVKSIILYDYLETEYSGEFVEPNIIKVYLKACEKYKRNVQNVILHEYTHYFICKNRFLSYLFNKLDTYAIGKCRKKGVDSAEEVYNYLPSEMFCEFISNRLYTRNDK